MNDVRDIVGRALALEGGIVEPVEPDALNLLASPAMQNALDVPEYSCLGFGAAIPGGAARVSLESDWIDRVRSLIGDRGSFLRVAVTTESRNTGPSHVADMAAKHINLANATYRLGETKRTHALYLTLVFHMAAVSDEKRDDIITVCLNESNGACADMLAEPLMNAMGHSGVFTSVAAGALPEEPWSPGKVKDWCQRSMPGRIQAKLRPFLGGMERRMARDLDRLHTYYSDLRRDAVAGKAGGRKRDSEGNASEKLMKMRVRAATDEYHAKIADLRRKYGMTVEIEIVQALEVVVPVTRLDLVIMRRKGQRSYHLDWNAFSKQLDILPCEGCGAVVHSHIVCDDRLHILCSDCMRGCQSCGREYCRACYGDKCPRCGEKPEA